MKYLSSALILALAVGSTFFCSISDGNSNTPSPQETEDRRWFWLLLFDGESTFGWHIDGEAQVKDGELILGGPKPTTATFNTRFGYGNLRFDALTDDAKDALLTINAYKERPFIHVAPKTEKGWHQFSAQVEPNDISIWARGTKGFGVQGDFAPATTIAFHVPAEQKLVLRDLRYCCRHLEPIFNGTDFTGWKPFKGETKREASKFAVTDDGEIRLTNGPGDLQTDKQFDNFVLQLDCKTNGKWLNSGVFFRCIPGQYQNGYEAQIHNRYKDNDRTKPADYGTGGIYRRVPARKVISSDNEWFTLTVVADGPHISTWVNDYHVVDWTDDRKPNENPRNGLRTTKGHLSIQGHDPSTDLLFRDIRVSELPVRKKEN